MTNAIGTPGRIFRPHALFVASRVTLILWIAGWVAFLVLTAVRASADLLAGIGAIICILFAAGLGLRVLAMRLTLRELAAPSAPDDLIASRSRKTVGGASPRVR
jgi:hypothetical protein